MPVFNIFTMPQPDMTGVPRTWVNSVQKTSVKEYFGSSTTSSGVATFYLTTDGTSDGPAIFSNVYKESFQPWIEDANNSYQYSNYTLAGNKKVFRLQ